MDKTKIKNLGCANGWGEKRPPEFVKCNSLGHILEGKTIGNCFVERYCPICRIVFQIDSSG